MALDDLMNCMARGMLWGFLTLMLMVLALALTIEPVARAEAANPSSESVAEESFDDIDPAFREYAAWSADIWCALLQDERPGVRVLASNVAEVRAAEDTDVCRDRTDVAAPAAVRQAALEDGWNDPAVIAAVYALDCHRRTPSPQCDPRLAQRFVELDRTNAFAILLPLSERASSSDAPAPFSDEEKVLLRKAAGAAHFSDYSFSSIHDTYRAFLREIPENEPRSQPDAADSNSTTRRPAGHDDTKLATAVIEMVAVLVARASPSFGWLYQGCRAAQTEGDTATVGDCLNVARIMARSEASELVRSMGRGIQYSLLNPEFRGAQREAEDPNRWRRQVHSLVRACVQHRGMPGDFSRLPGPMPMSHLDQYLADFQDRGERAANQNASVREYAAFPDAFALDPARCDDILLLDESTQEELVEQWLAGIGQGFEAWERVFEAAAVALDQQVAEGGSGSGR